TIDWKFPVPNSCIGQQTQMVVKRPPFQTVDKVLGERRGFCYIREAKSLYFKTFQPLFGIIKVSKKAVFFYDDTRNRKSKKANADCMY
ncbi:hypothetical protein, partial [Agathobacter sp.]|uniref:hypothetical protein n=1 Tax=Agathobacter sp. TaxID=2021311 RepID=UPI002A917D67